MNSAPHRAQFRATTEATAKDWAIIEHAENEWRRQHGAGQGLLRVLQLLKDDDCLGAPINVYAHCLQTATRALRDGADDELVVVALFHDMTEAFSENEHGTAIAQLLAPRISAARTWLLTHHAAFQSAYFAHHRDPYVQQREALREHPFAAQTDHFCRHYDQNSFDPGYSSLPIDAFEPIVRRFFAAGRSGQ